jgi:hypothetical protein
VAFGLAESGTRAQLELLDLAADGARVLERAHVVVREQLGRVLCAHLRLDPGGDAPMTLAARRARDLRVRDVTHQDVPERVLLLALHRRPPVATDELLPLECAQRLVHLPGAAALSDERAAPEDLPGDGGVLDQLLLRPGECVEPRGDQALQRVGYGQVAAAGAAALGDEPRELLGVERVPARAREDGVLQVGRQHRALEHRMDELRRLGLAERRERQRDRVRLPAAPVRTAREELGACRRDDEQRDVGRPVDEAVEKVEQAVVGPVEVLEDEHRRALVGERLDEPAPRGERLAASIRSRPVLGDADQRPQQ